MKTKIKDLAAILACVILVDEDYSTEDKECLEEIAEALDFKPEALISAVETELKKIKKLDDEATNEYLLKAAEAVDENEAEIVLESVMQMAVYDNVFTLDEADLIHIIAAALDIPPAVTTLLVADMVKDEEDMEIVLDSEE